MEQLIFSLVLSPPIFGQAVSLIRPI